MGKSTGQGIPSGFWTKVDNLIEAAADPEVKRILQYGTPQQKLGKLGEFGFEFEELVQVQGELEKIIFFGSLPFWWW